MNEENFTPEAHVPQETGKRIEIESNKRVRELRRQIERLQRQLEGVIKDLENREKNPNFQKARELFDQGYRLEGWGLPLTDTMNETILKKNGKEIGYWADGANRNTEEAFKILGLEGDKDKDEILYYLNDLTEEE